MLTIYDLCWVITLKESRLRVKPMGLSLSSVLDREKEGVLIPMAGFFQTRNLKSI
jgi:hypothetical protein